MSTNSLMSAPAMKPLRFAEHNTRPAGFCASTWVSAAARSLMTAADSTLVALPGISQVSQAMRSASTSRFQALVMVSRRGPRGFVDREIANERQVVRKLDIGNLEAVHLDLRAVQDEVEFLARARAWIGGKTPGVGIGQARRLHEQVDLVVPPIGVEIPRDDHRFFGLAQQVVQIAQLVLAVAKLERQVHQENGD